MSGLLLVLACVMGLVLCMVDSADNLTIAPQENGFDVDEFSEARPGEADIPPEDLAPEIPADGKEVVDEKSHEPVGEPSGDGVSGRLTLEDRFGARLVHAARDMGIVDRTKKPLLVTTFSWQFGQNVFSAE